MIRMPQYVPRKQVKVAMCPRIAHITMMPSLRLPGKKWIKGEGDNLERMTAAAARLESFAYLIHDRFTTPVQSGPEPHPLQKKCATVRGVNWSPTLLSAPSSNVATCRYNVKLTGAVIVSKVDYPHMHCHKKPDSGVPKCHYTGHQVPIGRIKARVE